MYVLRYLYFKHTHPSQPIDSCIDPPFWKILPIGIQRKLITRSFNLVPFIHLATSLVPSQENDKFTLIPRWRDPHRDSFER